MPFSDSLTRDQPAPSGLEGLGILKGLEAKAPGITAFFQQYSGTTFLGGMYRVHKASEIKKWTAAAEEMFPDLVKKIACFSSDWMGRQYAVDARRVGGGQFQVLQLDCSVAETFLVPCGFQQFHDEELATNRDQDLALPTWEDWLARGNPPPAAHECVGYSKPLFMGGEDDMANMEITDQEVYWSMSAQIWQQVKDLPPGTQIEGIEIE
jgi:hypothetical protein